MEVLGKKGDGHAQEKWEYQWNYVVVNDKTEKNVLMLEQTNRMESDHVPLEVQLEGSEKVTITITKIIEKSNWSK